MNENHIHVHHKIMKIKYIIIIGLFNINDQYFMNTNQWFGVVLLSLQRGSMILFNKSQLFKII